MGDAEGTPREGLDVYLRERLQTIQKRNDFDPDKGAEQVKDDAARQREFGAFQELRRLVDKLGLNVPIPRLEGKPAPKKVVDYVYIARVPGTNDFKIGHSVEVKKRLGTLNTSRQDANLEEVLRFPGGRPLEQALHSYFGKFMKQRPYLQAKEWCCFDPSLDTQLIMKVFNETLDRVRSEGPDFLWRERLPKDKFK